MNNKWLRMADDTLIRATSITGLQLQPTEVPGRMQMTALVERLGAEPQWQAIGYAVAEEAPALLISLAKHHLVDENRAVSYGETHPSTDLIERWKSADSFIPNFNGGPSEEPRVTGHYAHR